MEQKIVKQIEKLLNISKRMAYRYLDGTSLPPLDKAVLLEDELGIPVRYWIDLKNKKEDNLQK